MFGRSNLMKDGAQVDGVVLESKHKFGRVSGPSDLSVGATIMELKLEVQFEDGTTAEVERKLKNTDYGGSSLPLQEGATVPMRYDPEDRSQIEIDKAAMKARYQEKVEKEGAQVERLTDIQGAHKRGEISDEEFMKQAERELDL